MVNKSKAAGSFLGGITNNLGVVGIALGLGALFIFRDKISDFFQKGFDSLKFPDINLGDVNLPEIKFPEFPDFTNIFAGFQDQLSSIAGQTVDGITIPADTTVNPDGTVSSSTPPTFDLTEFERQAALDQLEINRLRSQLENELAAIPASEDISGAELASARNAEEFRRRQEAELQAALRTDQNVQTDIEGNQFSGGGVSFIGGSVTETPIRFLSLGQIIDRFGVSASRAADIRAQALNDFGDFDFGTNTFNDQGIPELQNIGSVSDQQFQGLTAEQIALRLTGGNISNF